MVRKSSRSLVAWTLYQNRGENILLLTWTYSPVTISLGRNPQREGARLIEPAAKHSNVVWSTSVRLPNMSSTWEALAAAHLAKQKARINPQWLLPPESLEQLNGTGQPDQGRLLARQVVHQSGLLTEKEHEITERYGVRRLLDELSSGRLRAEEVALAFCKRAALAQQLVSIYT